MWLPNAALKNPHFSCMVIFLLVVLGVSSYFTMPRAEDPQFDLPIVLVESVYEGATPLDIETLIVEPLESSLGKLENLKTINTSIHNGGSRIEVHFVHGINPDDAFDDVNLVISDLRSKLPQEAHFFVQKATPTAVSILQFALWTQPNDYKLIDAASIRLQKQLSQFAEVQKVERWGLPQQIVEVKIQPEKLKRYSLSVDQVVDVLKSRGAQITSGFVDLPPRSFNILSSGNFKKLSEIRQTIVLKGEHSPVTIADVAQVNFASDEPTYLAYFQNKPAVFLTVQQAEGGNIFELTEKLLAEVEAFKQIAPPELQIDLIFNQTESVNKRVNGFFNNLSQGVVLVGFFSFMFLGGRAALLITISVPLSFAIAIGVLDLSGFGLEQMSIVGLIIALGLLVDDAIIVTESVQRTKSEGLLPLQAAREGVSRIGMASTIGTFTTLLAFLPLLLLDSTAGAFLRSMPVTVCFVLTASLLLSLTLTPLMASRLMTATPPAWCWQNIANRFAVGAYCNLLQKILTNPRKTLLLSFLVLLGFGSLFSQINVSLFPKAEKPILQVDIETPPNFTLAETNQIAQEIANNLDDSSLVKSLALNIGNANPRIYYNELPKRGHRNYAQILVLLHDYNFQDVNKLMADWRNDFANFNKAKITVKEFQQGPVTEPPITFRLMSENIADLQKVSTDLENHMMQLNGIVNIQNVIVQPQMELDLNIDYNALAQSKVAVSALDNAVKTIFSGTVVANLKDEQANIYPVQVKSENSLASLMELNLLNANGELIPISQFINPKITNGQPEFYRYQQMRTAKVMADYLTEYSADEITNKIEKYIKDYNLPKGMSYSIGGEQESRKENFSGLNQIMLIAALSVLALLVFQFQNFIQPIMVFTSIPFAAAGAIFGLFVTGFDFSMMAFVGLISLFGIVVNNAIILIDTINQEIKINSLTQAILNASSMRLLPIILTTLTTIMGLLPLALFGGKLWEPLSWVIIWGLAFSTISSLLVIPPIAFMVIKIRK